MKFKYNFGILKNSTVQFKLFIDETPIYICGKLLKVEQSKNGFMFIFEDKKLEILDDTFLHMQIRYVNNILCFIQTKNKKLVSGLLGFTMFDTFGFPYELSDEILEEYELTLDFEEVENLKKFQKEKFKNTFKKTQTF